MMECKYCGAIATKVITVTTGDKPANPKHEGTQMDRRRVIVVSMCNDCLAVAESR